MATASKPIGGASDATNSKFFRGVRADALKRYQLLNHIGRGAYGEVWAACTPGQPNEKVAIKKITQVFSQVTEAKRILRELRILRHLDHPNLIRIRDCLHPASESAFADLWVCFDYVDLDLRKLIASPQTISIAHVQWITQQLLVALEYLHSAHVLHRDLKPANVLLSGTCDVKVCDFGLARVVDEDDWALNEQRRFAQTPRGTALARQVSSSSLPACPPVSRQMTTHVVTRWYRAPELILLQQYTAAIDVWSVGCILAELLTMLPEANLPPQERNALFPGRSCFPLSPDEDEFAAPANLDQLNVIFSVIGTPSGRLSWIELPEMRDHLRGLSPVEPTALSDLLPGAPEAALDLLGLMLTFEPARRCSVGESLAHAFFLNSQMPVKRRLATRPVDVATIDFENREMRLPQLRQLILEEIMTYAEPQPPKPAEADAEAEAEAEADADEPPGSATAGRKRRLHEGAAPSASEPLPSTSLLSSQGSGASASGSTAATSSVASTPQLQGEVDRDLAPSTKRHAGPTPVGATAPVEPSSTPVEPPPLTSERSETDVTPNVASYLADTPAAE